MATKVVNELTKAIFSLEEALNLYHQSIPESLEQKAFRDACIQRFEYSLELCWKTSMKLLGSQTAASKPAIREMARNNLIEDPSAWFSFIEARNKTSHSYDEDVAKEVFESISIFAPESRKLLQELQKL